MEKELGVALFDRSGRQIILTKAGQIFFDYYKEERNRWNQAVKKARRANCERTGSVRFGFVEGWVMPAILGQQLKVLHRIFRI